MEPTPEVQIPLETVLDLTVFLHRIKWVKFFVIRAMWIHILSLEQLKYIDIEGL
jgi:hypothetical protein